MREEEKSRLLCPYRTVTTLFVKNNYVPMTISTAGEERSVFDDDDDLDEGQSVSFEQYDGSLQHSSEVFLSCYEDGCAMWQDGKCVRRG